MLSNMSLLLFGDKINGLKRADCDECLYMKDTKDWLHWRKKTRNLMRGSMRKDKKIEELKGMFYSAKGKEPREPQV